jgi:hypothetical protein
MPASSDPCTRNHNRSNPHQGVIPTTIISVKAATALSVPTMVARGQVEGVEDPEEEEEVEAP